MAAVLDAHIDLERWLVVVVVPLVPLVPGLAVVVVCLGKLAGVPVGLIQVLVGGVLVLLIVLKHTLLLSVR